MVRFLGAFDKCDFCGEETIIDFFIPNLKICENCQQKEKVQKTIKIWENAWEDFM